MVAREEFAALFFSSDLLNIVLFLLLSMGGQHIMHV
jgi:hypothetical protein